MVNVNEKLQIYKCNVCGNMFEVIHVGGGEPICCGKPMQLLEEKNFEEGKEKHIPIVKKTRKGIKVKVGSIEHPMEQNHYIEWIEVIVDGKVYREFLKPGMKPEAEFYVKGKIEAVREYCNIHGLWKST